MKVRFLPFTIQLSIGMHLLLGFALYISYCYNLEVSAIIWSNFVAFFRIYWLFILWGIVCVISLLRLKRVSCYLSFFYYFSFVVLHLWLARENFSKAYLFYNLGLITLLFYFYDLLTDELGRAYYKLNFIKNSLYQKLGKAIKLKIGREEGTVIDANVLYWDNSGIVVFFDKEIKEIEKKLSVSIEIMEYSFDVELKNVLFDPKEKRASFMFLSGKKNNDTLKLQRRLQRLGWTPGQLV